MRKGPLSASTAGNVEGGVGGWGVQAIKAPHHCSHLLRFKLLLISSSQQNMLVHGYIMLFAQIS